MDTAPNTTNLQNRQRRRWIWPMLLCFACLFILWNFSARLSGARLHRDDDYLTAKARELHFNEAEIRAFVKDGLLSEPYEGALRGALGTLWSGAGNELDRALLFQALLERSRIDCRLVHGKAWGVEIGTEPHYRYAGPDLESDPEAQPIDLSAHCHLLETVLRTIPEHGAPVEERMEFRITSLIGKDLVLSYRAEGAQVFAFLQGPEGELASQADAKTAKRQELIFRFRGPGGFAAERIRELFTAEYKDFPSLLDPRNHYTFVVSAGWIPQTVFLKETELAKAWSDREAALRHSVAYAFLSRSDDHARELQAHLKASAFFAAPRLTGIATEYHGEQGLKSRTISIDLRKNDLRVDGTTETRVAFGSARSLFDASLEATVLTQFTGESAISSMDLLADAMAHRQAMLAQRQALLQRALKRLFDEAREGATLSVAPESQPSCSVTFIREKDCVQMEASGGLRAGLLAAGGGDNWVLTHARFTAGEIERAAQEIEVALALSAQLPMRYEQVYEYVQKPAKKWYENARFFSFTDKRLAFEFQNLQIEPDREVEFVDYFDDVEKKWHAEPHRESVRISKDSLEHARIFSFWYEEHADQTIDAISRDAYRELKEQGSTLLRYRFRDGHVSEPIRFRIVKQFEKSLTLNNQPFPQRRLRLLGNYENLITGQMSEEEIRKLPPIKDDSGLDVGNFVIIDDPEFPVRINFTSVQSSIPGRVTDTQSGRGVADARVTIAGPGAEALSWPDGRFSIPVIKEPFREFEVSVEAPGYKPVRVTIDFRDSAAFPLALKLEPAPREPRELFVRIDAKNAPSVLPSVKLGERAKALITEALRTNVALAVMVPAFEIPGPYAALEAWYEIDTRTGECYGRLNDGLYGATNRPFWSQHQVVSYFSGRIASWYLFAAGALDGVAMHIEQPQMTMAELHQHASKTARELAKIYDGVWFGLLGGQVADMDGFKKGLKHGLDWADGFYKQAWGVQ